MVSILLALRVRSVRHPPFFSSLNTRNMAVSILLSAVKLIQYQLFNLNVRRRQHDKRRTTRTSITSVTRTVRACRTRAIDTYNPHAFELTRRRATNSTTDIGPRHLRRRRRRPIRLVTMAATVLLRSFLLSKERISRRQLTRRDHSVLRHRDTNITRLRLTRNFRN